MILMFEIVLFDIFINFKILVFSILIKNFKIICEFL